MLIDGQSENLCRWPLVECQRTTQALMSYWKNMIKIIDLDRNTLHELEAIERLAKTLGNLQFGDLALRLAYDYPVEVEAPHQFISRLHHISMIGMSHAPFDVMRAVCEAFIDRVPELLRMLSYRHRDGRLVTVPRGYWLDLAAIANTDGTTTDESEMWTSDRATYASFAVKCRGLVANNQAETDIGFVRKRQLDGVPTAVAVEDLITRRRGRIAAPE
jgi:hypothetical protein